MNTKRIAAALGAAAIVVLGSTTSAFAAYETPSVELQLDPTTVVGGQSFTATATSNQDCTSWSITFEGPTTDGPAGGSGTSATTDFSTTTVDQIETGTVTATCTFDDGLKASALQQLSATADITVNPAGVAGPIDGGNGGGDDFGGLASTGGPH
ncbi:MAG: hypothetical protein EOO67_17555, partial [Microbacterium sp.]